MDLGSYRRDTGTGISERPNAVRCFFSGTTEAERVAFFAIPGQRRAPAVRQFIISVALSILLACVSLPVARWMSDKRSAVYVAAVVLSFPFLISLADFLHAVISIGRYWRKSLELVKHGQVNVARIEAFGAIEVLCEGGWKTFFWTSVAENRFD